MLNLVTEAIIQVMVGSAKGLVVRAISIMVINIEVVTGMVIKVVNMVVFIRFIMVIVVNY